MHELWFVFVVIKGRRANREELKLPMPNHVQAIHARHHEQTWSDNVLRTATAVSVSHDWPE
jgi:hypothetical protein